MNDKITEDYLTVTPAHGRDYRNRHEAESAFRKGRDFELANLGRSGKYCSIRDFAHGTKVKVRYNNQRQVTIVVVDTLEEEK